MADLRGAGRPRSAGPLRCDRCGNTVAKIRVHWPDGATCGACFSQAANTYGTCAHCHTDRLLPGRSPAGEHICRDCAGITTGLTCDRCQREAERIRNGLCASCVVTDDLTALLKPKHPPDLRLARLIRELATTARPQSIITWLRGPAGPLLAQIGNRDLDLSHAAFDALPPSAAVEHLRAMLVDHHILPSRGDVHLVRFEAWLDSRLAQFADRPHIHRPLEQFGRWHHLRRLRAEPPPPNMDYATRTAKQEITEAGKFLLWLDTTQRATIDDLRQAHIDDYWSAGPTTRKHIRNFLRHRHLLSGKQPLKAKARQARTTPMTTPGEQLAALNRVIDADNVITSTRIAALIFLLYGTPIGKIAALPANAISANLDGMTISLGDEPAPVPEPLIPIFTDYTAGAARHRGMNKHSRWLFPSTTAGQHISANTLWRRLRIFDIQPQALRNTIVFDLTKELDPATLAALLGYSPRTMTRHARRAGTTMGSYPTTHIDQPEDNGSAGE